VNASSGTLLVSTSRSCTSLLDIFVPSGMSFSVKTIRDLAALEALRDSISFLSAFSITAMQLTVMVKPTITESMSIGGMRESVIAVYELSGQ
jgi:hypothetical protein